MRPTSETCTDGPSLAYAPWLDEHILAWAGTNPGRNINTLQAGEGAAFSHKLTYPRGARYGATVAAQTSDAAFAWADTDAAHRLHVSGWSDLS